MNTITDFYYDMFDMWYDFDPFDSSVPDPFFYIKDVEVMHRAMAITTPSEDLGHYIETLKEFRQSCVDEEYDEFVERADEIAYTYRKLIENGIASVSDDELDERDRIAKRYALIYDEYFYWCDDEDKAARLAIKNSTQMSSEEYAAVVCELVCDIESMFVDYDKYAGGKPGTDDEIYYVNGTDLMKIFTKHFGNGLYEDGVVEIEDGWSVYAVQNRYNPKLFDHYDYCNLNQEEN